MSATSALQSVVETVPSDGTASGAAFGGFGTVFPPVSAGHADVVVEFALVPGGVPAGWAFVGKVSDPPDPCITAAKATVVPAVAVGQIVAWGPA